jgi:hypothetical protein
MKLTPATLKKFNEAPIKVSLWNGNFNKAVVEVVNNKIKYVLEVEDTHPILKQFSCVKEEKVSLWVWGTTHTGFLDNAPLEELSSVLQKMREAVKMTDEYASEVYANNLASLTEFYKDFYPNY